jgi:hypothetical protein
MGSFVLSVLANAVLVELGPVTKVF